MSTNVSKGVNVRISGKLQHFIYEQIGPNGLYESASEYIRELIRKDYERQEESKWQSLHHQLSPGMKAHENEFIESTAEEVIKRNRQKRGK